MAFDGLLWRSSAPGFERPPRWLCVRRGV